MKLLFLDIDGVLNGDKAVTRFHGFYGVDPVLVARLNRVLAETGAAVVLSSSWRQAWTLDAIEAHMREHGFTGTIVGKTPSLAEGLNARSLEVARYLEQPVVTADGGELRYAIVDDMALGWQPGQPVVQTDGAKGLTDADADKLIALLNS